MAITSASHIFTQDEMLAATNVNTWITGLSITTHHDTEVVAVGSAKYLMTIIFE